MSSSRNVSGRRPTLPSIRDVLGEELHSTPRTPPESPSLTLARLRVHDDVPSIQRGSSNHPGDVRSSSSSTTPVRRFTVPLPPSLDIHRGVSAYPSQVPYTYPHPLYPGPSPYIRQTQERTPTARYPVHNPIPYDPAVHDHRSYVRATPLANSYKDHDFSGSSSSQTHLQYMDQSLPSGSKYECGYCGKGFNRPSSLKIHLNSHTGEKPFRCPVESCGRSFSVLSNMRRHARVHTQPSKDASGDEGSDSHTRRSETSQTTTSFAERWHHRRDSSASSTSSSGSRQSYSVSSDSGDELDVRMPPEKRRRPSYSK